MSKIIFLCSSLEPTRDGVGDYTRRLSSELMRKGNHVEIIALNDKYVDNEHIIKQKADCNFIDVVRLPNKWTNKRKFDRLRHLIDAFNPDFISLQYVPFGFNTKGLPFGLGRNLYRSGRDRIWHIMFHEIWVGLAIDSSRKYIFWGWLQRRLIISMLSELRPLVISTHSTVYEAYLSNIYPRITKLPLFSNIAITSQKKDKFPNIANKFSFVIFGSIHPESNIEFFVKEISSFAKKKDIKISVSFVGNKTSEHERWISLFNSIGIETFLFGNQPDNKVSEILRNSTFGITTSSFLLIEKSSSVSTMLAHDLPVICIAKPFQVEQINYPLNVAGVFNYQPGLLSSYFEINHHFAFQHTLENIARQFLDDLENSENA